jgi:GNAT superfamily N-acetyltransferase
MLTIRTAEGTDLRAVAGIHVSCWNVAYRGILPDPVVDSLTVEGSLRRWERWCRGPGVRLRVAERDGTTVGFCRLCPARDIERPPAGFAEVTHLYVSPRVAGSGVGHALFTESLALAHDARYEGLLLWVLERNDVARRFYEAHGMGFDGGRRSEPEWLGEGVFEVRYRRELGDDVS